MAIQHFRNLTAEEFEQATTKLRLRKANTECARQVLVEGFRAAEVARKANITRQAIHETCRRVWLQFLQDNPMPKGWIREMVELPPDEMQAVRQRSAELKNEALKEQAIKKK